MADGKSKESSGMVVRFLEDSEEPQREDALDSIGIELSRSCSDLNERTPRSNVRLHHTMPGRLQSQLSHEGRLMSDRAHQIGRANWSGGWQNTILIRRREGIVPSNEEDEMHEIAHAMQTDSKFMVDTVDGELMRRNTFREMTKSLKLRRQLKHRVSNCLVQSPERRISLGKNFKYHFSIRWLKFRRVLTEFFHDYSLWHGNIIRIEGIFGRNVGSFFYFLRDIVLLNILMSLIVCGFLFVPQLLHKVYGHSPHTGEPSFGPLDWITGAGWFEVTLLYYGGYSNGSIILTGNTPSYNMTYSYFFAISLCHLAFLVILLLRVCNFYKIKYIDVRDGAHCNFTRLIFTGWDFQITDENAGKVKRRSLYNEFIESIQELLEGEEKESFCKFLLRRTIQLSIWLILLSFMAVLSWGMYVFLTNEYISFVLQDVSYLKESLSFLLFPLVVTSIMYIVPVVFDNIGKHELYMKKQTAFYITLIRVTILELVILAVLFIFWYGNSPGLVDELPSLQGNVQRRVELFDKRSRINATVECWESALGQEIYRLVLIDFIFILVNILIVDTLRAFLVKKEKLKEAMLEFNLSRNILHIIYNQTLLWAGLFFCPLLPLIITFKFICIFYLHKFNLTINLRPNDRPWRASQSETVFNSLALLSLILAIFSYGFIIVRGYSSENCGPFQEHAHYIDFILDISRDSEKIILQIVKLLFKPVSITIFIGILSIFIVCAKNIAEGRIEMVALLQQQLQLEIEDKKFYLTLMDQVQRGNYKSGTPLRNLTAAMALDRTSDSSYLSKRASFTFIKGTENNESSYSNGIVNEENHYQDSKL